jgi:hypothetical protein
MDRRQKSRALSDWLGLISARADARWGESGLKVVAAWLIGRALIRRGSATILALKKPPGQGGFFASGSEITSHSVRANDFDAGFNRY